jgi:MFS family permease
VAITLGLMALLSPLYALVVSVPVLMLVVLAQGVTVAAERPAVYSEVARVVPPEYYARAQGVLLTGLTVAQSVGAIASGFLYGISPSLVFSSVAVLAALSLLTVPFMSRRTGIAQVSRTHMTGGPST